MHKSAPIGKTYTEPSLTMNWQPLKAVNKFTCLWRTLSRKIDIFNGGYYANFRFGKFSKSMLNWLGTMFETKIKVCNASVAMLLYSPEICIVYRRHAAKLDTSTPLTSGSCSEKHGKIKSPTQTFWRPHPPEKISDPIGRTSGLYAR